MNAINDQKIKTYDELNVSEKELIDCFRQMKLLSNQARFELFSYKLTDLLNNMKKYLNYVMKRRHYCLMCLKRLIKMTCPVYI